MAHSLVQAYLGLPLGERDAALTNLIRSVGRREQALVQGLISDTRDPFYNLPIEVLIYLFDFLHPYDVWSKRLICRRWNAVLSSDNFTRTALNRFETHDPEDSAVSPENHASSSPMLALRHTLALRNGRPFCYVNYGDQFAFLPNSHPIAHQLRLKGKHTAYLRGNPDTREGTNVVIRDLVTGETTSLCGTAREKIMLIELSTNIVAFFTYTGTVYIASLLALSGSLRAVRLPSSKIHAAHADRGLLACLLGGTSGLTVFVHDAETRKSTSFSYHRHEYCDKNEEDHCHAVLINSHDRCIDILSVVNSTDELELHVKVARYSLAGERKLQDHMTTWHGIEGLSRVALGPILPTGERGLYQLTLSVPYQLYGTVLFDANFAPNTVTLKMVDRRSQNSMVFLWKDRLYRTDLQASVVLVDTAQRRRAPFDGPHSLRALSNEAWSRPMTEGEKYDKTQEDEEQEMQDKKNVRPGTSTHWRPSALRDWRGRRPKVDLPPNMRMAAHTQDQLSMLPEQRSIATSIFEERRGLAQPALHTIVAMNDTFAVGTCRNSGYIGVICFDERVNLYGAGRTDLWAHRDHYHYNQRPDSRDHKQFGPGLLALDRQKCAFYQ